MEFQENSKPIYLQIVDRICALIMDGTYAIGARIPSVRDYATSLQVNPNTVMRSYEYLSREDVIYNRRGIGFFVCEGAIANVRRLNSMTFFNGEIQQMFQRLNQLKITPAQLNELYIKYLDAIDKKK